jgi:dGTP triphosphohydrolase
MLDLSPKDAAALITALSTATLTAVGFLVKTKIDFARLKNEQRQGEREDKESDAEVRTQEHELLLKMQETASHWIDQQAKRNDELKQQYIDLQQANTETIKQANAAVHQANTALEQTKAALANVADKQQEIAALKAVIDERDRRINEQAIELGAVMRANERLEGAVRTAQEDIRTVARENGVPRPMRDAQEQSPPPTEEETRILFPPEISSQP